MTALARARRALVRAWQPRPAGPVWTMLGYATAAMFFTIAALAAAFVALLVIVGLTDLGGGWLAAALVIGASTGLGWLCLPARPGGHRAPRSGRHRRVRPSGEADVVLYDEDTRDELNEQLLATLALESFRPAHDHRVRPAVPPDRDRLDGVGGDHD